MQLLEKNPLAAFFVLNGYCLQSLQYLV